MLLLIKNLLDEDLVQARSGGKMIKEPFRNITPAIIKVGKPVTVEGIPFNVVITLTNKGNIFIKDWVKAKEVLTY